VEKETKQFNLSLLGCGKMQNGVLRLRIFLIVGGHQSRLSNANVSIDTVEQ
jgi:hypothetical protein